VSCRLSLVETLAYVAIRIIAIPVPKTNVNCHDRRRVELRAKRVAEWPPFLVQAATGVSGADGHEGKYSVGCRAMVQGLLVGWSGTRRQVLGKVPLHLMESVQWSALMLLREGGGGFSGQGGASSSVALDQHFTKLALRTGD
jgi:hypothetical protein